MAWVNEHGDPVARRPRRPSSHGGSWFDAPENPFNQMDYTRGGGGEGNRYTHHSNARRAHGMTGVDALPRFASPGVAQAAIPGRGYAVVDGNIIRTTGPGAPGASTNGGGTGTGPGNPGAVAGRPRTAGSGTRLAIAEGGPETTPIFAGGSRVPADLGWSDGADFEDRWGEWGGALAGLGVMGADGLEAASVRTERIAEDLMGIPQWAASGVLWAARMADQTRSAGGLPSGLPTNHYQNTWIEQNQTARFGADGTVWRTGGGF